MSYLMPTFLARLADPDIKVVMLTGCGGGFDFVHSMLLYPELKRLGKTIIIGSYSFGRVEHIGGDAPVIFEEQNAIAKSVSAMSTPHPHYAPEIHISAFLDSRFPEESPHFVYAYYARSFTVSRLRQLYAQLIREHNIDAVIMIDGGSDGLMVGDEEGLGDPVEDATSVAAVASLTELKLKVMINVSLGTDRYLHVSDSASLRAVAELTTRGGFLGSVSIEPNSVGFHFYKECIDFIYSQQSFRSVHVGTLLSAIEGYYGGDTVPLPLVHTPVKEGRLFIWPLMAIMWAFDVEAVAERSLLAQWIAESDSIIESQVAVEEGRYLLGEKLRGVENLPRHEDMRKPM